MNSTISTQTLALRATTTRSKPRWQPYNPNSTPCSSQLAMQLKSPTQQALPTPDPTRSRQIPTQSVSSPDLSQRDSNKQKFVAGLVDQAVRILTDIWTPHIVPSIFMPASKITSPKEAPNGSQPVTESDPSTLLPIRPFVHEVLRRSRTSGTVLQTALCYLEALRTKVPELSTKESIGIRDYFHPESRIMLATEAELAHEVELAAAMEQETNGSPTEENIQTIRIDDILEQGIDFQTADSDSDSSTTIAMATSSSTCTSPLPCPLLCPRRAFMASLILASKFSQDKCYSNRAWAKLSGLPPREVGRCERALGEALEWRLWVGKRGSPSSASTTAQANRPISRCSSESAIVNTPSTRGQFLRSPESLDAVPQHTTRKPLGRSSTLPAESFIPHVVVDQSSGSVYTTSQSAFIQSPETYVSESSHGSHGSLSPDVPSLTNSPSATEISLGSQSTQSSSIDDFPSYQLPESLTDCGNKMGRNGFIVIKELASESSVRVVEYEDSGSYLGSLEAWHHNREEMQLQSLGVY